MPERQAIILFKGQVAGTLRETVAGGTLFAYGPDWREPIACCLPVAQREHAWDRGLHPFFQHLGTEGWLREQQARFGHLATEDDLGLLLRHGLDCIGAVGVRPAGPLTALEPLAEQAINPGRTVSGVQRKLLVTEDPDQPGFWRPAGPDGPAPYIAKFNSESLPTLVRNEALSLRWTAAVLGSAEVNHAQIGPVSGTGEPALIVTRFDRTADGAKLRMEDMAQILCRPRGNDYAGKYEGALRGNRGGDPAVFRAPGHRSRPLLPGPGRLRAGRQLRRPSEEFFLAGDAGRAAAFAAVRCGQFGVLSRFRFAAGADTGRREAAVGGRHPPDAGGLR